MRVVMRRVVGLDWEKDGMEDEILKTRAVIMFVLLFRFQNLRSAR